MRTCRLSFSWIVILSAFLMTAGLPGLRLAKDKTPAISPDDLTLRLFQLLDTSYGGKLAEFYFVGDVYKDPKIPDKELQHILKAEYEKDRAFGRLRLYVLSVDKLSPGQMDQYTPKQIDDFAEL